MKYAVELKAPGDGSADRPIDLCVWGDDMFVSVGLSLTAAREIAAALEARVRELTQQEENGA